MRLAVARFGEMDLARWWNTTGQLGNLGATVLRRGFPRTHRFAQARSVLAEYSPLVDHVAGRMPTDPDPLRDVVFILRTGALFPVYRAFSLLEQLKGRVRAPTMLLYPGHLDGAAGLRLMGVLAAEHNYRPKVF